MVHRGAHKVAVAAMLQHGFATKKLKATNLKSDSEVDLRYHLRSARAPPSLTLLTVGAKCLLSLSAIGPGRYERMQKLREAGALEALTLAATEPERDVYDWSRHGFRQSAKEMITAGERASRANGNLLLLLWELSEAFEQSMLHEMMTRDIAHIPDAAADRSYSSAVLESMRRSALPDAVGRDVDMLSKQLQDAAAFAGCSSDDDSDPNTIISHMITKCRRHTSPRTSRHYVRTSA
jgi:hypothetical protein